MARPIKKGLDYYPQDVDIFSDRKIKKLIAEFGAKGFLIYEYVKSQCFKENGYWIKYDDNFCFDVCEGVKAGTTDVLVEEVIKGCIRLCLFSEKVFNAFQIITSSGIQKRYLEAKRNPNVIKDYWVIAAETRVITTLTPVIAVETPVIAAISTQSKVKESKVKESKEGDVPKVPFAPPKQIPNVDPNRPDHAPTFMEVYEFFWQQNKQDESVNFFNYYEGLGWKKGITAIVSWRSFANTWISNPITQKAEQTPPNKLSDKEAAKAFS